MKVFTIPGQLAVLAVIEKDGKYLLQRRYNSSWRTGWFSLVGGRVEGGESMRNALCRELKEEIGINTNPGDLKFLHVKHISPKVTTSEFIYNLFLVQKWDGVPFVAEPDRSDKLEWFSLDCLPDNFVPVVKEALLAGLNGITYSEYGWLENEVEKA